MASPVGSRRRRRVECAESCRKEIPGAVSHHGVAAIDWHTIIMLKGVPSSDNAEVVDEDIDVCVPVQHETPPFFVSGNC